MHQCPSPPTACRAVPHVSPRGGSWLTIPLLLNLLPGHALVATSARVCPESERVFWSLPPRDAPRQSGAIRGGPPGRASSIGRHPEVEMAVASGYRARSHLEVLPWLGGRDSTTDSLPAANWLIFSFVCCMSMTRLPPP